MVRSPDNKRVPRGLNLTQRLSPLPLMTRLSSRQSWGNALIFPPFFTVTLSFSTSRSWGGLAAIWLPGCPLGSGAGC